MKYYDLHKEIGNECASHPDYCGASYTDWEKNVAQPLLEKSGWAVVRWADGERDSFGPLTRYVICRRGNEVRRFIYG